MGYMFLILPLNIFIDYWCRMLGFEDAVCAVQRARFGQGSSTSPIWMDNINCNGYESALDFCYFPGWGRHSCGHYEDAGVVCEGGKELKH